MESINFNLTATKHTTFQETADHRTSAAPGEPPYLKTTESGHAESLEKLKTIPSKDNGVYLGFAFEFNYHLLAERPIQKAYICDINPRMLALYEDIERLVLQNEDRNAFIKAFRSELSTHSEYYFGLSEPVEEVLTHLTTLEHSWLASDRKYETIRELYRNHKIVHLSLNVGGSNVPFQEIAQELQKNRWVLDCVYLSNIPEWLYHNERLDALRDNLSLIMSADTVLIDAKKEFWEAGMPKVRITRGSKLPDFKPARRRKTRVLSRFRHAPRIAPFPLLHQPPTLEGPNAKRAQLLVKRLKDTMS